MLPFIVALLAIAPGFASSEEPAPPFVSQIKIEGNQRVEADVIKIHIRQQPVSPLDQSLVHEDIRTIYRMGFFNTVNAKIVNLNGANILVYTVKERPLVTEVRVEGMKAIPATDDSVVAAVKVRHGGILDPSAVEDTIAGISTVYAEKGYPDAKVSFRSIEQPDNSVVAVFDVVEGPRLAMNSIEFVGNTAFSSDQLRDAMRRPDEESRARTTPLGLRHWLNADADKIRVLYYDHGYLGVAVDKPEVVQRGDTLRVTFAINEGPLYHFGRIGIIGDLEFPRNELESLLAAKEGQTFESKVLQQSVLALAGFYSNRGYAFVNVDPRTRMNEKNYLINVDFYIEPGSLFRIDRILIEGNAAVPSAIIRRELWLNDGDPYSAQALREWRQRLDQLGVFRETKITTAPSSLPNRIDIKLTVEEKKQPTS